MPKTLDNGPWDYLPVLNECIKIMVTILIGFVAARFKALEAEAFVPQAVQFVFTIALPFHIMRGIGVAVDFYDESFLWTYMAAFLVLRVIALVFSVAMVMLKLGSRQTGIGQVAVNWLCLSWISTVILGVPIAEAVFGDVAIGLKYGMFAGVSSFIFQLPFQLFFLECHLVEQQAAEAKRSERAAPAVDVEKEATNESPIPEQAHENEVTVDAFGNSNNDSQCDEVAAADEISGLHVWVDLARRRDVWTRIAKQVIANPVVCGIAIGFFLSLSTIGPEYLNPTSPRFVPGLAFIWETASWLGECVSPVSLIVMGVWMEKQGRSLFRLPPISVILYMLSKLLIVPLVMVGLAKAFDFNDEAGRAAILIAALPISMAAFALGSHYDIGQNILSANVAIGTLLILPTVILWNIGLDAVNLYPIAEAP